MPGGYKKIHEHPNQTSNGFDKRPTKSPGRPRRPDWEKELEKLLLRKSLHWVDADKTQTRTIKGKKQIGFEFTQAKNMALKFSELLNSKDKKTFLEAYKYQTDRRYGKAQQSVSITNTTPLTAVEIHIKSSEKCQQCNKYTVPDENP